MFKICFNIKRNGFYVMFETKKINYLLKISFLRKVSIIFPNLRKPL